MRTVALLVLGVGLAVPGPVYGDGERAFWPWLSPDEIARARLGRVVFEQDWVAAPGRDENADGLGPLFNERSCASCHNSPLEVEPALRLRASGIGGGPHPSLGRQLQTRAIEGVEPEGRLRVEYEALGVVLGDGTNISLRRPVPGVEPVGEPVVGVVPASLRMPRELDGIGLIEMVSERAIERHADPQDADDDGISGRVRWLDGGDGRRIAGRFGWKADMADLEGQTAGALSLDMGLSSRSRPDPAGDCTRSQAVCRAASHGVPEGGGHEVSDGLIALIGDYLRALAFVGPAGGLPERERNAAGASTFTQIGCARCHVPILELEGRTEPPDAKVELYSDLLLHDMGGGLAEAPAGDGRHQNGDGGEGGKAANDEPAPGEWRTAPLAGLSRRVSGNRDARLLHDGRARTIEEAILWHGGEAQESRTRFSGLSRSPRALLIEYLSRL